MQAKTDRQFARWVRLRWALLVAVLVGVLAWHWHSGAPLRAARAAERKQAWHEAIHDAADYLQNHPGDPETTRLLARCLCAVGRVAEAEQLFAQVPHLSVSDLQSRGRALLAARQWDRAAEVYERILRAEPDNAAALQQLAAIWARSDRLTEALELAARLARHPSHAASGHALQALLHHRRKEWDNSVTHWQKVLELDPDVQTLPPGNSVASVRFYLAEDLLRLGRVSEARAQWEQILKTEPKSAQDLEVLGSSAERLGDLSAAGGYWRRALELEPDEFGLKIRLGQLELELGHVQQALAILSAAARECRPTAGLHQALASAYAANGERELSLEHRAKAEELRPQEELERGIAHILISRPESVQAKLILAARAYEAGDYAEAERQSQAALRQDPDRADARQLLERIHARLASSESR